MCAQNVEVSVLVRKEKAAVHCDVWLELTNSKTDVVRNTLEHRRDLAAPVIGDSGDEPRNGVDSGRELRTGCYPLRTAVAPQCGAMDRENAEQRNDRRNESGNDRRTAQHLHARIGVGREA
jgi:hypothetical protein